MSTQIIPRLKLNLIYLSINDNNIISNLQKMKLCQIFYISNVVQGNQVPDI